MTGDRRERQRRFGELNAADRAALVRTHMTRWLAFNAQRLTAEQIELLEEHIALIEPELYEGEGKNPLPMERNLAAFSREDVADVFTLLYSDAIPAIK